MQQITTFIALRYLNSITADTAHITTCPYLALCAGSGEQRAGSQYKLCWAVMLHREWEETLSLPLTSPIGISNMEYRQNHEWN